MLHFTFYFARIVSIKDLMLKKIAIAIGVIIAITIVASWTFIVLLEGRAEEELEAARQRLSDTGAPMTIEAILPPPIAEEDNASALYLEATAFEENNTDELSEAEDIIWELGETDDYEPLEVYDMDDSSLARMRDILKTPEVIQYISIFEKAAKKPHFQRDYSNYDRSKPEELVMPEVGTIIDGVRFLDKRSSLSFLDGENAAGLSDLKTMAVIATHISEDKVLISQLTAAASVGILLHNIALADRHTSLSSTEIDLIKGFIFNIRIYDNLIESNDMERLLLIEPSFEQIETGDTASLKYWISDDMLQLLTVAKPLLRWHTMRDHAFYLNATADTRKMYRQPYHKISPTLSAYMERSEAEAEDKHFIFSSALMSLGNIGRNMLLSDAMVQLTIIGLSLTQYHNDQGAYPESLDQLLPNYLKELPIDPFSGNEFIYRREGDGYFLYSVGPNMRDDGGTSNEEDYPDKGDLLWKGRGSILPE